MNTDRCGSAYEWPTLAQKSSIADTVDGEEMSQTSSDRTNGSETEAAAVMKESAVDLSVRREINNKTSKQTSKGVSKIQTVLGSLQKQQIMQMKLVKRECSRVIPTQILPSSFISPPSGNESEVGKKKTTTSNYKDDHLKGEERPLDLSFPNAFPKQHVNDRESRIKGEEGWESMMDIKRTDEAAKIRQLVGDKSQPPVTDPKQCFVCRRVLSCKSALQMHYRTHTGERPYKCKICLKAFKRKWNLKIHMGVHRSTHPFIGHHQCPICQKRSLNSVLLQQHIRVHTNQRRSSFNLNLSPPAAPPKERITSGGIQEIKVSTTHSKPESSCGSRKSSSAEQLGPPTSKGSPFNLWDTFSQDSIQRMWGQTEPSPPRKPPVLSKQQCGVCFKHFSSSSALQIHMAIHTRDKAFKCTVCTRAFTTEGNLNVHKVTHMWHSPSRRGRRIFDFPVSPSPSSGEHNNPTNTNRVLGQTKEISQTAASSPPDGFGMLRDATFHNTLGSGFITSFPTVAFAAPMGHFSGPPAMSLRYAPTHFFSASSSVVEHSYRNYSGAIRSLPVVQRDSAETMMWMWRNVCSVCHRVCSCPTELQEHLKLHLSLSRNGSPV